MSLQNKINQLTNILQILESQKGEDVALLANLKAQQQQRIDSLHKLIHYKTHYIKEKDSKNQSIAPILHNNFEMFIQKLNHAITNERVIIDDLEHRKVEMISKIAAQDQKIEAIQKKLDELSREIANRQDITENTSITELYTQQANKE